MPLDLVFVRHAQSEANVIQKADKDGLVHEHSKEVTNRPDWQQRLSKLGIEQAQQAREWIDTNLGGVALFDYGYVSTFLRTRETAGHLGTPANGWALEDRIVERNWGIFGTLSREERDRKYKETVKMRAQSPWFVKLDGGESLYDVRLRWRDMQESLLRGHSNDRILLVTHGDFMSAARYDIERQTPEEFDAIQKDETQDLWNCTIIHYSRVNPDDPSDIRPRISWRRMTYPTDETKSPFGGEWVSMERRRYYSDDQLLSQIDDLALPLIPDSDYDRKRPMKKRGKNRISRFLNKIFV